MTKLPSKKDWAIPEREATAESVFYNRRKFIKAMGIGAVGTAGLVYGVSSLAGSSEELKQQAASLKRLNAKRNGAYVVKKSFTEPLTDELIALKYNNFYEFSTNKGDVWELVKNFRTDPWKVEVTGMVEKPTTFDVGGLIKKMPLEERVYRFRCVEAWSMVVPWTGFTMKSLLDRVRPLSKAKYVRLTTMMDTEVMPRTSSKMSFFSREPWPYTEGLRIDEAMNELTLLTVGMYGHILPKQHGAPLRLITPWKYGYKSIKSIVKIELTDKQPATFWNTLAPGEYGFLSNVNPRVPHPRWSQASERVIGTGNRQRTLPYNGYAPQVAGMYSRV